MFFRTVPTHQPDPSASFSARSASAILTVLLLTGPPLGCSSSNAHSLLLNLPRLRGGLRAEAIDRGGFDATNADSQLPTYHSRPHSLAHPAIVGTTHHQLRNDL